MIHPSRDIPVDRTDFVTRLVLTDLVKIHALALENAVVLPGQSLADQPVGPDLNLPNLLKNFAGNHGNAECGVRSAE
jgi:hypothetical protein